MLVKEHTGEVGRAEFWSGPEYPPKTEYPPKNSPERMAFSAEGRKSHPLRGVFASRSTLGISAGDALPTLFTGPLVRAVRKQLKLDTPSEGEGVGLQADLENA